MRQVRYEGRGEVRVSDLPRGLYYLTAFIQKLSGGDSIHFRTYYIVLEKDIKVVIGSEQRIGSEGEESPRFFTEMLHRGRCQCCQCNELCALKESSVAAWIVKSICCLALAS